jgi:hypothetical protein
MRKFSKVAVAVAALAAAAAQAQVNFDWQSHSETVSIGSNSNVVGAQSNVVNAQSNVVNAQSNVVNAQSNVVNANVWPAATGSVLVGSGSIVAGDSVAVGADASATAINSVAVGKGAQTNVTARTAAGPGVPEAPGYTTGGVAVGVRADAGHFATATGYNSKAVGEYSTASGSASVASAFMSNAVGFDASATAAYATAIGAGASATAAYATAIGPNALANQANTVSFGRDFDDWRRLVNVADGVADSDVSTVRQVKVVDAKAVKAQADATTALTTAHYAVQLVGEVANDLERKAEGGTAVALATANAIPSGESLGLGETMLGASLGAYGSSGAVAVGFAHRLKDDDAGTKPLIRGSASFGNNSKLGATLGAQWKF